MIKDICEICNENYNSYPSWIEKRRTCSRVCAAKLKSIEKRGENHPMFGRHHTDETKLKLSMGKKGTGSEEKKGNKNPMFGKPSWNRGKKQTEEVKKKIRDTLKKRFPDGRIFTKETKKKMSESHKGEKSHLWKGGITPFYRILRVARLKSAGGSHTKTEWETLKEEYNLTCPCCKRVGIKLTKDHVIPITKGGSDSIDNIQPLCNSCNSKKMTKIIKYKCESVEAKYGHTI